MFPISTLHNKIFISADFEAKKFAWKLTKNRKNRRNFFGSKSAKMKILLCKVDMGNKLYETKFFDLWCKKLELMEQNHLLKIGFVIFLKGATFSDFVEYRLWNCMPSGIQICIPLFWGKFFQLDSCIIKQWLAFECMISVKFHKIPFISIIWIPLLIRDEGIREGVRGNPISS